MIDENEQPAADADATEAVPPEQPEHADAPAADVAEESHPSEDVEAPAAAAVESGAPVANEDGEFVVGPPAEPAPMPVISSEPPDYSSTFAPMAHPDGGTCDLYETDRSGHLLVPVLDVPTMLSHGFVLVSTEA